MVAFIAAIGGMENWQGLTSSWVQYGAPVTVALVIALGRHRLGRPRNNRMSQTVDLTPRVGAGRVGHVRRRWLWLVSLARGWLLLISLAAWLVALVVVFASDASDRAQDGAMFVAWLVTLPAVYVTHRERDR